MQLLTLFPVWACLAVSFLFFAAGEYLSKKFALGPSLILVLLIVVAYIGSTLAWLPAIFQDNKLAVLGVIWIILALIADLFIGLVIFQEQLNTFQWVGLIFGTIAVVLLSL